MYNLIVFSCNFFPMTHKFFDLFLNFSQFYKFSRVDLKSSTFDVETPFFRDFHNYRVIRYTLFLHSNLNVSIVVFNRFQFTTKNFMTFFNLSCSYSTPCCSSSAYIHINLKGYFLFVFPINLFITNFNKV